MKKMFDKINLLRINYSQQENTSAQAHILITMHKRSVYKMGYDATQEKGHGIYYCTFQAQNKLNRLEYQTQGTTQLTPEVTVFKPIFIHCTHIYNRE
jgi:hypothetical protein